MNKLKEFYTKFKYPIYMYLIIFLGLFILIAIATRWFTNPSELPSFKYDSRALVIASFEIQWYAVFIIYGIMASVAIGRYEAQKKNINLSDLYDGILICVPAAILGARFYYLIFDGGINSIEEFFGFYNGQFRLQGLAIHGGIFATFLVLIPFCHYKKISFWLIVDVVAPAFFIGQAIGRWGNFMNCELYGPVIKSSWLIDFFPDFIMGQLDVTTTSGSVVLSGPRHPTFLYESLWNIIGFMIFAVVRRKKIFRLGDLLGLYLIWYGLGRGAIIEPLRYNSGTKDALMLGNLPFNILMSLVGFISIGIAIIVLKRFVFYKNNLQPFYSEYQLDKDYQIKRIEQRKNKKKNNDKNDFI